MGKTDRPSASPARRSGERSYTTQTYSTSTYSYIPATTVSTDRSHSQPWQRSCTVAAGTNLNSHSSQSPSTGRDQPQTYVHNGSWLRYRPAAQDTHLTNHSYRFPSAESTQHHSTPHQPSYPRAAAVPDVRPVNCSSKHPSGESAQQIPRQDNKQSYYSYEPAIQSQGDAAGQHWSGRTFASNRRDQSRGRAPSSERPAPVKTVNPTSSHIPTKRTVAMEYVPKNSAERAKEYESPLFMRKDSTAPASRAPERIPVSDLQFSNGAASNRYSDHTYSSPQQDTPRGEELIEQLAPGSPKRSSAIALLESHLSSYASPPRYQGYSSEPDMISSFPLYKAYDAEKEERVESEVATKPPLSKSLRGISLNFPGERFIRDNVETKSDE